MWCNLLKAEEPLPRTVQKYVSQHMQACFLGNGFIRSNGAYFPISGFRNEAKFQRDPACAGSPVLSCVKDEVRFELLIMRDQSKFRKLTRLAGPMHPSQTDSARSPMAGEAASLLSHKIKRIPGLSRKSFTAKLLCARSL